MRSPTVALRLAEMQQITAAADLVSTCIACAAQYGGRRVCATCPVYAETQALLDS